MRRPKGFQDHAAAPKEFRHTPNVTGSHELDVMVKHCRNKDVPKRLSDYLTHDEAYGPLTGYSGYRGYRGDS